MSEAAQLLRQASSEAARMRKAPENAWESPSIQRAAWRLGEARADEPRLPAKPEKPLAPGAASPPAASPPKCRSFRRAGAATPAGSVTHLDELSLGARLACLAYTDDEPGTVLAYDTPVLRGTLRALEEITGGPVEARKPLSTLLKEQLDYTADCVFSHQHVEVDTQGFIAHSSNGDVVLAFRGTTSAQDWSTNVDTLMTECDFFEATSSTSWFKSFPSCCLGSTARPRAHHGFSAALAVALPDVERELLPRLRESASRRRVIVAGHSLGGALATGAFAYLLGKFNFAASPHEVHLVTLGSPRFGDERFVAKMMARVNQLQEMGKCSIRRVVHHDDVVPTVPPELFGFLHVGGLCRLVEDTAGHSKELEGNEAVDAPELGEELVTDHEPVRYLHSIDDFVQRSIAKAN